MDVQEIRKRVGHRIRVRRVDRDMDQGELAAKIGMTQAQLSGIEKGKRPIRVEQLVAIAEVLDCSTCSLLGEEDRRAA